MAGAFGSTAPPRLVNENLTHGLGGDAEKVGSVLIGFGAVPRQAHVHFVHKRRGLQGAA